MNAKFQGRSRWSLPQLDVIAEHWNVEVIDLLQGPAHAVHAIVGSAPRQRDRTSVA